MRLIAIALLFVGVSGLAMASAVPEIDAGSAGSALALLTGALLIVRSRRRK